MAACESGGEIARACIILHELAVVAMFEAYFFARMQSIPVQVGCVVGVEKVFRVLEQPDERARAVHLRFQFNGREDEALVRKLAEQTQIGVRKRVHSLKECGAVGEHEVNGATQTKPLEIRIERAWVQVRVEVAGPGEACVVKLLVGVQLKIDPLDAFENAEKVHLQLI